MAKRKPYISVPESSSSLADVLKQTKSLEVTEDVLRSQRISFAFGNAMNIDGITKDTVRHSSEKIRLRG